MSWNITHQCRFQSRTGQQYCVNISKQADTGQNIKQLTGSEHPFVTSEANGDDIFMPIRQQTGYLRVLDNSGGTLIDELLPENNTQKMVTLVNLTTGKTEWIGFLAAEVFTQPWGNELTELEFPLKSALACLSDITIQTGAQGINKIGYLINYALNDLFLGENMFDTICIAADLESLIKPFILWADYGLFFKTETSMMDGADVIEKVGISYKEALNIVCQTFGISMREQGTTLCFFQEDNAGFDVGMTILSWGEFISAIDNAVDIMSQGSYGEKDIISISEFRSTNNKLSFRQGGKSAKVVLQLGSSQFNAISLPETPTSVTSPDVAQVVENMYHDDPNGYIESHKTYTPLNIQAANVREGLETFTFCHMRRNPSETATGKYATHTYIGVSDYNTCLEKTLIKNGTYISAEGRSFRYYWWQQKEIYTGAIPCRWGTGTDVLKNGIFLVQDVFRLYDTEIRESYVKECYSLQSNGLVEATNAFLCLNLELQHIFTLVANREDYFFGNQEGKIYTRALSSPHYGGLRCKLYIVDENNNRLYWKDVPIQKGWVSEETSFDLGINKGKVISNKTSDMNIDGDDGYYVPFNGRYTVHFCILNIINFSTEYEETFQGTDSQSIFLEYEAYPYQNILTDLTMDIVYPRDITINDKGQNVYRKTIMSSGFSDNKETSLRLGTNNNNAPSPALLRNNRSTFIEKVNYIKFGAATEERPEMHLLNRMVEYYKTMRRTMEAKIATGIDLFRNRFSYNGRKYMAIDKKHDWEREEQEVKFIEVT